MGQGTEARVETLTARKLGQLRRHGLRHVSRKFFADHVYRQTEAVMMKRDLSRPVRYRKFKTPLTEMRFLAGKQDLDGLARYFPDKSGIFVELLNVGVECLAGFVDDAIVCYYWVSTESFDDKYVDRYFYRIDDDEIYQFAGIVAKPYMGTNIALEMLRWGWAHYHGLGYRKAVAAVGLDNEAAVKFHFKLDFEECGTVLKMRKFLGFRQTWPEIYQGERFAAHKPVAKRARSGPRQQGFNVLPKA